MSLSPEGKSAAPIPKPKSTGCLCAASDETERSPSSQSHHLTAPSRSGVVVRVFFTLRAANVRPWERVFVCGGCPQLGRWRPQHALEMENREHQGQAVLPPSCSSIVEQAEAQSQSSSSSSIWRASIELDAGDSQRLLRFRYFVGYRLQADPAAASPEGTSPLSLLIARWEANAAPRCILPSVEANSAGDCNRGVLNEFGTYGGHERLVLDGWLNGPEQRQIFLRLFGNALRFFDPKLAQRQFLVRITPSDVRMDQEFNFTNSRGPVSWRTPSLYMHSLDSLPETAEEGPHCPSGAASSSMSSTPLPSHSSTEFANLLRDEDPFFREQSEKGELFRNDGEDYFVFRTTSVATEFLAFRIELFVFPQRQWTTGDAKVGLTPSRFAVAYCMPSSMPDTLGSLSLPLVAVKTQKPVGQIKVDYLLATPVDWGGADGAEEATNACGRMEHTFAKHWKKRRTLEVGHRGSGESFTKFASVRENTIFSLNNAVGRGADFVEFDVQLSRDRKVVIFHDFHVLVSVAKRSGQLLDPSSGNEGQPPNKSKSEADLADSELGRGLHQIALRDLTLAQLRLLHVHHTKAMVMAPAGGERENGTTATGIHQVHVHPLTGEPDEALDLRPFPTLVEALQRVDEHTGFNVEIKYPMRLKDGTDECDGYPERNQYMDRVLNDVFRHAGGRRIVFSSFDPDICTLLSVKQNRYPVLFLCVGETARYVPFLDERSNVSRIGTNFAACSNLLGVNLHSEELLSDPGPLKRALDLKLIVFVWGEDLGNLEHVGYFRRLNVNAVIYDRVGELETRQNVFIVEREAKSALFKTHSPRASPTLSRTNSFQQWPKTAAMAKEDGQKPRPSSIKMLSNGLRRQMTVAANGL